MRKIQNFFSYFRASELSTNQFSSCSIQATKGRISLHIKLNTRSNKDILSECELEAYEELLRLIIKLLFYPRTEK